MRLASGELLFVRVVSYIVRVGGFTVRTVQTWNALETIIGIPSGYRLCFIDFNPLSRLGGWSLNNVLLVCTLFSRFFDSTMGRTMRVFGRHTYILSQSRG